MTRRPRPGAVAPFLRVLVLAALIVAAASLAGSAQAGPDPQSQPTATPTKPPPTPTPSPADLTLAAEFARLGRVDEAIGAYLAVIDRGPARERLPARFGLAQLLFADGQLTAVVRQLDVYLLEAPAAADVRPAQFLLAEALSRKGGWEDALPLFEMYVQSGGRAATYARLGRAEALARVGRSTEALAEAELLLQEPLPASARLAFILGVAQALEAPDPQEAIAWYERLRRESDAPADQALALWQAAVIRTELDRTAPAIGAEEVLAGAWEEIVTEYPEAPTAQAIVNEPPAGATVDGFYSGLVHYRAGRTREARAAFQASLTVNRTDGDRALAARSAYYLAIIDEAAGDMADAIAGYARVPELDPESDFADDALWWRGRLLERTGRTGNAVSGYERLLDEYGESSFADEARFRLALLDYDAGEAERAAAAFRSIAQSARDEERQRAILWQGKALDAAGDDDGAEVIWRALQQEAPTEYYGLRAAVLLGDGEGSLKDAGLEAEPPPDWTAIEQWLLGTVGKDPAPGRAPLLANPHWRLGKELLALGLRRDADAEFAVALEGAGKDVVALYHLARLFHGAQLAHESSRAATRLLDALPDRTAQTAPAGLWRLAYPAPFLGALRDAADEEDVTDLLLLAMVRQESFFDPLAGSSAGALGLTQVIPATGRAIARDLGAGAFAVDDLFRPAVSLRFGAHYLAQQLDAFDGEIYPALAAYNGGPNDAQRWRDAAGGDVDRFVAEIEFAQTRAYVELVAENLARYRQLYQGLDEPVLPKD